MCAPYTANEVTYMQLEKISETRAVAVGTQNNKNSYTWITKMCNR